MKTMSYKGLFTAISMFSAVAVMGGCAADAGGDEAPVAAAEALLAPAPTPKSTANVTSVAITGVTKGGGEYNLYIGDGNDGYTLVGTVDFTKGTPATFVPDGDADAQAAWKAATTASIWGYSFDPAQGKVFVAKTAKLDGAGTTLTLTPAEEQTQTF
jgi:hypothetical protein